VDVKPADADRILLSILIPTYKRPQLLVQALESVAAQTRPADEVIVIDNDGAKSAANTVEMFNERLPNLKYLPSSAKNGAAYSMNVGAQAATGSWLVYLDDDDYWDREYLASVEDVISEGGSDCVITWIAYDIDGVISGGKRMPRSITIEELIKNGNPGFIGSNIAIEKSLYDRLEGLDESMPSSPDLDFLIRIVESGATYRVIEKELTFLHQHSGPRLTDQSTGYRAIGAAKLLEKHGHKVSWTARRRMNGRMHAGAFAASNNPISRWRHAVMATLNGNRSVAKKLLKRPW
jgi:glycosyltransferase involved in cell wall biosynthesis